MFSGSIGVLDRPQYRENLTKYVTLQQFQCSVFDATGIHTLRVYFISGSFIWLDDEQVSLWCRFWALGFVIAGARGSRLTRLNCCVA